MDYRTSKVVSLRAHPEYNEKWLQQRIVDDARVLGLGDLVVRDVERRQPRAGRLDLLLQDPEEAVRYEVEIQLGQTDETHIIRTIEYWDIERRRYPQYDHVAVIVAEDITSRFLNVIGLFNGFIPLIAIQLRALQIGDVLTLSATTVLDRTTLGEVDEDDDSGSITTDRSYWEKRGTAATMKVVDEMLSLVHQVTGDDRLALKYNKFYIGLARDGVADNFVDFRARKQHVIVGFKMPPSDELRARIEAAGLEMPGYDTRWRRLRVNITSGDVAKHHDLLAELVSIAAGAPASTSLSEGE